MTTLQKIEKQNELFSMLDSFGCKFQSKSLDCDSEMAYTKNNGAGVIATIISNDVDLNDVLEDVKIDGMKVVNLWNDNVFNTVKFPVKIVTFE